MSLVIPGNPVESSVAPGSLGVPSYPWGSPDTLECPWLISVTLWQSMLELDIILPPSVSGIFFGGGVCEWGCL